MLESSHGLRLVHDLDGRDGPISYSEPMPRLGRGAHLFR